MDDVTADLLISELDAMEAVDREWEDNDVSDLDLDAIEERTVPATPSIPQLREDVFALIAEVREMHANWLTALGHAEYFEHATRKAEAQRDALRERVATLEGRIKRTADFIRDQDRVMAGVLDALLDVQGDTEGE